jgi:DNA invertase Pin-like site-specific DNA recombinase
MAAQKTFYYARVSTTEQNLDRQIDEFKAMGAGDRDIFFDKASGKDLNRPQYQVMKAVMRDGDTLVIKSLDRLSRNKADIMAELSYYEQNKVRVKIIDIPTTMLDIPTGQDWILKMIDNVLFEVLSSFAEQERIVIKSRQSEGIAAAQARGKLMGRPKLNKPENWQNVYIQWINGNISAKTAMTELNFTRTSFYKTYNENKTELEKSAAADKL